MGIKGRSVRRSGCVSRWSMLMLAIVFTLSACSGGGTVPNGPLTTIPPAQHSDDDQGMAEQALPMVDDVGPGYRATPFTPSSSSREEDATLNVCLGRPPTVQHETARAFSSNFTIGDARAILVGITFVDAADTARADLGALADLVRAGSCLKESLLRQLRSTGATVEVIPIDPPPGGDGVVAYRLRVVAGPPPVVFDLVSAVRGRAEVSVSFQDVNQPVPADLQDRLVRLVLDRLPA